MVLFVVLAIVRWDVAWAYIPLIPLALDRAAAAHERARDPALGDQRLPARHVALPRARAARVVLADADRVPVPARRARSPVGRGGRGSRTRSRRSCSSSSARSTRGSTTRTRSGGGPPTQLLPHWPYWGFVAYLGYSLAFALIVARDRDAGVRALGGELRGGALDGGRDRGPQHLQAVQALPRALHVAEGAGRSTTAASRTSRSWRSRTSTSTSRRAPRSGSSVTTAAASRRC